LVGAPVAAGAGAPMYDHAMKTLTVRLPDALAAKIEAESRRRRLSKSDVVRERLTGTGSYRQQPASLDAIAHLIGSVDGLPRNLSARTKQHLRSAGCGDKRTR
jgi:Arc/MetJ-type ribon-helix-helix transcriptional regulator